MKCFLLKLPILITYTSLLFTMDAALANGVGKSPCVRTAKQMFNACKHDIQNNLITTLANCINITERRERLACNAEAKVVKREEMGFCVSQFHSRLGACETLGEDRYDIDPLLDPAISFVNPDDVDFSNANPYVSIVAGHTYVLRAGEEGEETVVVHVTDESREIQGVLCRVIVDAVVVAQEDAEEGGLNYVPVEVTDDWFAQDVDSNVYYCGEVSRNFEEGVLVDIGGSFEAGRDFAKAGVLIMSNPILDLAHRQEFSLGEAEDIIQYVDLAAIPEIENQHFSCADVGGCLKTFDFAPLNPVATEYKYYLPGVGFVLAEGMKEGVATGEREELVCVGDNLDILWDEKCGIEDPAALSDALCALSSEAFCDEENGVQPK